MKKRYYVLIGCLLLIVALYFTAAYSNISWIQKWRNIYIETALNTLDHQWLATALLPESVWKPVELRIQAAESSQIGLKTEWPNGTPPQNNLARISDLDSFLSVFPETEPNSLRNVLQSNPHEFSAGWEALQMYSDKGLGVFTIYGDELLCIDVPNRLIILRMQNGNCTGAMAICADPYRLSLRASSKIGTSGETTAEYAAASNAVLSIPASAFDGANDGGNGGVLAGYAMCSGVEYGEHLSEGNKRLEIRNHVFYITDSINPVQDDCQYAVEFRPALIVDGAICVDQSWASLHPRVCIGQTQSGNILMLVMEGRINGSASLGASLPDCASMLAKYNCQQAMNLDGGNSAMMWYNGMCVTKGSDPDHPEGRPVPTAFVYG